MFNFKNRNDNILNEFMLSEDEGREVRATFGKYHVFEPNKKFYSIMAKLIEQQQQSANKDINSINISIGEDNSQFFVELLDCLTDLPKGILTVETFNKIIQRPKRIFRLITKEIENLMYEKMGEVINQINQEQKMLKAMTPKQRKIYKSLTQKALNKVQNQEVTKENNNELINKEEE